LEDHERLAVAYQVKSPLVVVRTADDGPFVHVYEGGFLPEDADPDHVAQLVESGMVEEAEPPVNDAEDAEKPARRKPKR
jgi:hypothetical protein